MSECSTKNKAATENCLKEKQQFALKHLKKNIIRHNVQGQLNQSAGPTSKGMYFVM